MTLPSASSLNGCSNAAKCDSLWLQVSSKSSWKKDGSSGSSHTTLPLPCVPRYPSSTSSGNRPSSPESPIPLTDSSICSCSLRSWQTFRTQKPFSKRHAAASAARVSLAVRGPSSRSKLSSPPPCPGFFRSCGTCIAWASTMISPPLISATLHLFFSPSYDTNWPMSPFTSTRVPSRTPLVAECSSAIPSGEGATYLGMKKKPMLEPKMA
mmetsp:Transcript_27130/g.77904  ORF Transcript_27130/g.77904 Transcript_27130/m.77904 type:complete len:210 (+) Transcript_27130:1376-2005(+)